MATKIQFRRDTAANWASINPVLSEGEIGLDLTNNQFKIGDGVAAWNSIQPWSQTTTYTLQEFVATAGQTVFTVTYSGLIEVRRNGFELSTSDYTGNGTSVTLLSPASVGDLVVVKIYSSFNVSSALSLAGGTLTGKLTVPDFKVNSTSNLEIAKGTTAERPTVPVAGMMRFNTTIGAGELYNGTAWKAITDAYATGDSSRAQVFATNEERVKYDLGLAVANASSFATRINTSLIFNTIGGIGLSEYLTAFASILEDSAFVNTLTIGGNTMLNILAVTSVAQTFFTSTVCWNSFIKLNINATSIKTYIADSIASGSLSGSELLRTYKGNTSLVTIYTPPAQRAIYYITGIWVLNATYDILRINTYSDVGATVLVDEVVRASGDFTNTITKQNFTISSTPLFFTYDDVKLLKIENNSASTDANISIFQILL